MRRDNWTLGSGLKAGDDALAEEDGVIYECRVIKVKGGPINPNHAGNVLLEIVVGERTGERIVVIGSKTCPITRS